MSDWDGWYNSHDWDATNKRLAEIGEPDYTLHHSQPVTSGSPRFSVWYRLPVEKRPPQIEGKRRSYNVRLNAAYKGADLLGNNYQQIQAEINGKKVIVNKYEDGTYAVKVDNHVYRADESNLDDVIDTNVE